jgi:hypothetical protein
MNASKVAVLRRKTLRKEAATVAKSSMNASCQFQEMTNVPMELNCLEQNSLAMSPDQRRGCETI